MTYTEHVTFILLKKLEKMPRADKMIENIQKHKRLTMLFSCFFKGKFIINGKIKNKRTCYIIGITIKMQTSSKYESRVTM